MRSNTTIPAASSVTASPSRVGGHENQTERSSLWEWLQPPRKASPQSSASAAELRPKANTLKLFACTLAAATALLTGCSSTNPPKPLSQLTPHESDGYRVYQAHCAVCHYDRKSDPLHGPPLRGVFQKKYLPSGAPANDDRVTATIQRGRGMMPAQPNLDPQEVNDLLAYLHTL